MRRTLTVIFAFVALMTYAQQEWTGTWATAPQSTSSGNMPKTAMSDCAIRQTVHVSLGGNVLRLQLSNEYSNEPLTIKSVYVADALDSCDIETKSARYLTFNGKRGVEINAGKAVFSDALKYSLKPLQRLSITINYAKSPAMVTSHPGSRTTSYIIKGTSKPSTSFKNGERADHWYNISAIDIYGFSGGCVAVLGNSITDGRGSTTNHQNRWTDACAEYLLPQQSDINKTGILNLGIGGNCVLNGGLGDPALQRFDRDIMGQRNVKAIILFEGVNDIGNSKGNSETVALKLIEAMQKLAQQAHAQGIKVYGATITPFKGHYYYTPFHEAARVTVNEWIRTAKELDGVIDFDKLMCDPSNPSALKKDLQEDWLHPNAAGYKEMGRHAAEVLKKL